MITLPSSLSIALNDTLGREEEVVERTFSREDSDERIHRHHGQQRIELMVLCFARVNEEAFCKGMEIHLPERRSSNTDLNNSKFTSFNFAAFSTQNFSD